MSSTPPKDHKNHLPMIEELTAVFKRRQRDGVLAVEMDCALYCIRK